jgi:diacylglycerol kinase (ATP)
VWRAVVRTALTATGYKKMKIMLIANPGSGRYKAGRALDAAKEYLSQGGNKVDVEVSLQPGWATKRARRAVAESYDVVVGCGGDGTLREVVCGLVGSNVTMGIIPLGTGNVIAMDLGIPRSVKKACEVILEKNVRQIDVGRCGENHFILAAGVGFDVEVIVRTDLQLKSKVRNLAYIYAGAKHLPRCKPREYIIESDAFSGTVNAMAIAICNSYRYGGYRLKRGISLADGMFDVCVIRGRPPLDTCKIFLGIMCRAGVPRRNLMTFKASRIKISAEENVVVHNDGDVIGKLPMEFEVIERGLPVIVPRA